MVLLKVSCREGNEMAVHPKHYGVKVKVLSNRYVYTLHEVFRKICLEKYRGIVLIYLWLCQSFIDKIVVGTSDLVLFFSDDTYQNPLKKKRIS